MGWKVLAGKEKIRDEKVFDRRANAGFSVTGCGLLVFFGCSSRALVEICAHAVVYTGSLLGGL